MIRSALLFTATGATLALASSASAFVDTMYAAPTDPSTYGNLVASKDILSTSWFFPVGAGKLDSGYVAETVDGSGNPTGIDFGTNPFMTTIVSDVYEVTTPTSIPDGSGNLNLQVGDLVFAYRIQLVGNNTNTVESMYEFSVGGIEAGSMWDSNGDGDGYFDSNIVLGRGYTVDGLAIPAVAAPATETGDFFSGDLGIGLGSFSQLDFGWEFGNQSNQLQNAEQITLLMFTRGAIIADGFGKLTGVSGQAAPTTDQNANRAPLLIPAIPAPGALALAGLVGLASARRRRF